MVLFPLKMKEDLEEGVGRFYQFYIVDVLFFTEEPLAVPQGIRQNRGNMPDRVVPYNVSDHRLSHSDAASATHPTFSTTPRGPK